MKHDQDPLDLILTAQLEILRRIDRIESFLQIKDPTFAEAKWRHLAEHYLELVKKAEGLPRDIEEVQRINKLL